MGFSRPRFNQKARSHRSQPEEKPPTNYAQETPSVLPSSGSAKPDISQGSMSRKRKRRFDAFVDRQMKKEKRNDLIKSLEQTQRSIKDPSSLISTSNLSSASICRTQKDFKAATDQVELRRQKRARALINSRKRSRSGYHSLSECDDVDDNHISEDMSPVPSNGSINPPSTNLTSGNLTFTKLTSLPLTSNASAISAPDLKIACEQSKPALGSALAKDALTVVVKHRTKKPQIEHQPERFEREDSFDSSDSELDGEMSDSPSAAQQSPTSDNTSQSSDVWSEEEWQGCDVPSDEDSIQLFDSAIKSEVGDMAIGPKSRVKGSIRDWANEQLLRLDTNSSVTTCLDNAAPCAMDGTHAPSGHADITGKSRKSEAHWGPLGASLDLQETPLLKQKTIHVPLSRPHDAIASRSLLPVYKEEHTIMDAVRRHPVVVICGETGSGKTTQVPQFLYEAGWGKDDGDNPGIIGVTQPRRVAAVSMARRVELEMGLKDKGVVGYQIRYDTMTGPKTKLKFMTDGVILRELAADFLLSKYSVIIIDEAHERSVNTDVLIGVLSRVVRLRMKMWQKTQEVDADKKVPPSDTSTRCVSAKLIHYPLRLIIMSATLRVADFTHNKTLFSEPPPVIQIAARQYPVAVHFNKRTAQDYVREAFVKASKIHSRLPGGGVLIFLTGQMEISQLCRKLEHKFGERAIKEREVRMAMAQSKEPGSRLPQSVDPSTFDTLAPNFDECAINEAEAVNLGKEYHDLAHDVDGTACEEDPEALDTDDEDDVVFEGVELVEDSHVPMHVLPLYSLLPTEQQMRVFEAPPPHTRLVVVATNVAETSLTIPNIRYVIDSGRVKERHYDLSTGIQSFEIDWVSKASAAQRAGRAGRTGPGHCYRLYSSAVFENYFPEFSKPEIQRMPIDGIVLQMKSMNIDTVTNFPFPTPPDRDALRKAEIGLAHLGALSFISGSDDMIRRCSTEATITNLGRAMARYPLSPRYARMLVSGFQHDCLPYVIAIVSLLSVGDPFIRETEMDEENPTDCLGEHKNEEIQLINKEDLKVREIRKQKRRQFFKVQHLYSSLGNGVSDVFKGLAVVGAYEFSDLRNTAKFCQENFVRPKAMEEIHKLRVQITRIAQVTTAASDITVEFSPKLLPPSEFQMKILRQLITSAFIEQVAVKASLVNSSTVMSGNSREHGKRTLTGYRAFGITETVHIHPSSILSDINGTPPDFVVFQELQRTGEKVWIKGITKINPSWLPTLGKALCSFSKPLDSTIKVISPDERKCIVIPKFGGPGLDVELSPIEITQRKDGNRWTWV